MDGVIVSTGTRISTSIMICLYLHEIGVRNILAKAQDDDHSRILKRVGATEIIHPERDMALRVSRGLSRPNVLDFIPLAEDFDLIQVSPPAEFVGKNLKDGNSADWPTHSTRCSTDCKNPCRPGRNCSPRSPMNSTPMLLKKDGIE
jgi:Trk K+ transport system NAD-binding subunit